MVTKRAKNKPRLCSVGLRIPGTGKESCRSSGYYGYGSLTEELTQVPGRYTNAVPVPVPAPGYICKGIPLPRVLCHGRAELTQVPGTGMNVVQN